MAKTTNQSEETGAQMEVEKAGGEEQSTVVRLSLNNGDDKQKEEANEDSVGMRNDLKIQIPLSADFMKKRATRSSRPAGSQEEVPKSYSLRETGARTQPTEKRSAIVRTRSGREISSNIALRQTRGSITTRQNQERSTRLMTSSKETSNNVKPSDDADEGVYTGRLRTRKAGSRIKEYDSDDDGDFGYLLELEKQSTDRKKVKQELNRDSEQRAEEILKVHDSDTRGSGSNQEFETGGVRTRNRLRSSTFRAQEQSTAYGPTEQAESNPLEQNFSGVRTRSRLSKGPSLR
mgnify:CR=1 FL=1